MTHQNTAHSLPEDPIFGEYISIYTTKDGVEDGFLIDAEALAPDVVKNAFRKPYKIILTEALYEHLKHTHEGSHPATYPGMIHDILNMYFFWASRAPEDADTVDIYLVIPGHRRKNVILTATIGPYDMPGSLPAITFDIDPTRYWRSR